VFVFNKHFFVDHTHCTGLSVHAQTDCFSNPPSRLLAENLEEIQL